MSDLQQRRRFLCVIAWSALTDAGALIRPRQSCATASDAAEGILRLLREGDLDRLLAELPDDVNREAARFLRGALANASESSAALDREELMTLSDAALIRVATAHVRRELPDAFDAISGHAYQIIEEIPAGAGRAVVAYRAADEELHTCLGQPRALVFRSDDRGFSMLANPRFQVRPLPAAARNLDSLASALSSLRVQVTDVHGGFSVAGRSYCCVFTRCTSSVLDCDKASLVEVSADTPEAALLAAQDWDGLRRHFADLWQTGRRIRSSAD